MQLSNTRAIGFQQPGSIERNQALVDIELPTPKPEGHDILVKVEAVSVNPVDTKVRKATAPEPGEWKVIGWDAAGIVTAIGSEVTLFKTGDEVFYAGSITRSGTNAEYHLVDERIDCGHQAQNPRLGCCCCLAAHDNHGLGNAV